MFSAMSEGNLNTMLKSTVQKTIPAGKKIVEQGHDGVGFYLILDGEAEVVKNGEVIATLKAGNFFGELSVIDGEPRTADVVAKTDTTCMVITQWAMKSILISHPEIALGMVEELVRRLRASGSTHDAA
jgi:CRP-like cAMP-binding protein